MNRRSFLMAAALTPCLRAQLTLTPAQLREDFNLMRRVLESAHSGLYRYASKQQMDDLFREAEARLSAPLSSMELHTVLTPVLAGIRCGHTGVGAGPALAEARKTAPMLPLRASMESGRMIVALNESTDSTVRPGMEIVSINDRSAASIASGILPHLPADGDVETGKLRSLGRNLPGHYFLFVEKATSFNLRLNDAGRWVSARLNGVVQGDREKNGVDNPANTAIRGARAKLEWTKDNIAVRFLNDAAQIRVGGFGGRDFPAALEKCFSEVHAKKPGLLILDLRGNGGGVDNYGALLVSYLTDKPFRYFDRIRMKTIDPPRLHTDFGQREADQLKAGTRVNPDGGYLVLPSMHGGLKEQQPQKNAFTGKVAILIDGGSFSTCADVCAVTHHLRRATFIGEETGGGYYGNNSGASLTLTLPNSKITVNVPMWEYWNHVPGYKGERRGTIPDHLVPTRISDTLSGRDAALERALSL